MSRIVVLALLGAAAIAHADPVAGSEKKPSEPGSGSNTDIAPPAPTADPDQVKKAKDIAGTANLTPIVPNPKNPTRPAYLLYAELDPPILATGLVFVYGRSAKTAPAFCAPVCMNQSSLNFIDKQTAGYYSAGWGRASDVGLYGLGTLVVGTLLIDEGPLGTLNDMVVIGEATLSATALASIMTLAAGRPRPLLYSDKAPLSIRNSGDAGLSFISSHTAMSFALATSLFVTEHRLHPKSNVPYYMLGGGLAVASFVGVARVMSGYHFITDAIGGALVGSSVGIMITSVHKSPVQVVPAPPVEPNGKVGTGIGISGKF